ncbi:hypothetical protein ACLK19_00855 [Escherichia coli]
MNHKNMAWRHNPNYRNGVPYHDQDMAKRFHQTDVNGGISATQLPAPTRDSQRQAGHKSVSATEHAAPVITRDTQRQAAAQRLMKVKTMGAMTTSATSALLTNHPATKGRRSSALSVGLAGAAPGSPRENGD